MMMPDDFKANADNSSSELNRVLSCIERLVRDGMRHGHFHYEINGTVGKSLRREVVIEAGVSHKFTVNLDDLNC